MAFKMECSNFKSEYAVVVAKANEDRLAYSVIVRILAFITTVLKRWYGTARFKLHERTRVQ